MELRSARRALTALAVVLMGACGGGSSPQAEEPATATAESERPSVALRAAMFEGEGPAPLVAALRTKFGENVRVVQVTIYPDRANVRVQDPAQKQNLDDWQWSAKEGLHGSRPVHTSKSDNTESKLFGLGEVHWAKLPALAQTALTQLALPDATVTHAIVDRDSDGVGIRLYVDGPRRGGYLEATADGRVLKVEEN